MNDIEYITKCNRLSEITTKIINISAVCYYLNLDDEEEVERKLRKIHIKPIYLMGYDKYYLVKDIAFAMSMRRKRKI